MSLVFSFVYVIFSRSNIFYVFPAFPAFPVFPAFPAFPVTFSIPSICLSLKTEDFNIILLIFPV